MSQRRIYGPGSVNLSRNRGGRPNRVAPEDGPGDDAQGGGPAAAHAAPIGPAAGTAAAAAAIAAQLGRRLFAGVAGPGRPATAQGRSRPVTALAASEGAGRASPGEQQPGGGEGCGSAEPPVEGEQGQASGDAEIEEPGPAEHTNPGRAGSPRPAGSQHAEESPPPGADQAAEQGLDSGQQAAAAAAAGGMAAGAELEPLSSARPRSAPTTSRPGFPRQASMPKQSLYERLKGLRPAEQREELEEQEAYWDGDEDLQERRMELQRRQQDEAMLERIKRRMAGEKMEVPRVIQKLKSARFTPRLLGGQDSGRSAASNSAPSTLSGRWPLVSDGATAGSAPLGAQAAGPGSCLAEGEAVAEGQEAGQQQEEPAEPGCWTVWWPRVQRAAEALTTHPDFQLVVMLVIIMNCTALALYRPSLPDDSSWNRALQDVDVAVNVLFTLEMVLMVLAAGGPVEYLRGPWNVFDFLMVLAGYTAFIPTGSSSSSSSGTAGIRALRALRALRPLRTITRFESLRSIVVCFLEAVPMLVSVIGLLSFFMLLFAIAATVLFLDSAYFACVDAGTGEVLAQGDSGEMWGCGTHGFRCPAGFACQEVEMRPPLATAGFGNIGLSLLSMFQVTTLTDWTYQLYLVMDRLGPAPFIFYVFYIFLQCYFVVNLFLAVLKHRFATATTLYSKVVSTGARPRSTLVLAWQALKARLRRHMDTQRSAFEERMSQRSSRSASSRASSRQAGAASPGLLPPGVAASSLLPADQEGPPKGFLKAAAYWWFELRWRVRQVVDHWAFVWTFMALIIANTVLLAMTTADMSAGYARALDVGSQALTVLFAVEVALKLLGLGAWGFLSDGFNAFDALVVLLGLVEMALTMGANGNALRSFRTLRILRSFRVLRVLKIFRYLDSLRVISEVMMGSMGQFLAVALLMVLFIFVFALIGLQVFSAQSAAFDPPLPSFLGFWNSFILVFQVLTLENWPDVMFACQQAAGWPSVLFFVAWVTVGKWIILCLFLAITLFAFEQSYATVTRTTTGGTLTRVVVTLTSLPQKLWASFSNCCCFGRRKQWQRIEPAGVVGREELWEAAAAAKAAVVPAGDGEPPPLDEAAAKEAGAALSAAISAKLASKEAAAAGGKACDGSAGEPGSKAGSQPEGQPAAEQAGLIRAAAGVDSPFAAAAEQQPGQPPSEAGQVNSMVRIFESLSLPPPAKPRPGLETLPEEEQDPGSAVLRGSGRGGLSSAAGRPRREGMRARFADTPEGDGEGEERSSQPGSASAGSASCSRVASPLGMASRGTSPQPILRAASAPVGGLSAWSAAQQQQPQLPGQQQQPGQLGQQAGPQQEVPEQPPRAPRRQGSDQSLAAELQDADDASQFSGISGASSVSSHFSRLTGAARRRSRRKDYPPLRGKSLWLLPVDNPVRNFLYSLMTMQAVDWLLVAVVVLSCVEMAMETASMDPAARKTRVLQWIDVGTNVVFALEAALKIVAFGFRQYIKFNTNRLDFVVVTVSIVVLIAQSLNARFLKALRVLRAVRPLRMLTRSQSMLMVFHTLVRSLAAMGNVTVLAGMVFLIFAILGVQLFAGLLWSCNDGNVAGKDECMGSFLDPATGALQPREWSNQWTNFDNVGNALLTLFITSTLDGYTPAMYMSMATSRSTPGMQPVAGSNPAAFLFWIAFITLCSFFVLNLYIGVVFFQYQRLKLLSETGSAVLTATQTGHVEMLRAVFRLKPLDVAPMPANHLRRWFHLLAYSPWFDRFMLSTILLNIALTATTFHGQGAAFTHAQETLNTVFSALVLLELAVKLTALGPKLYWQSNWHRLDGALSVAALVDIATQVANAAAGTSISLGAAKKVMMLARVLRMFRLLRHFKGIQMLLSTLLISLPAIINVGALLSLLFFIFAYLGVQLFGEVAWQEHINAHATFSTFPRALLVLFRVATGDNWAALLQDCMVRPPACDPEAGNCGHVWAAGYFVAFYLSGAMIALNLLVTVQLEVFEKIQDTANWALTPQHLEDFVSLWSQYDQGSNSIDPKDMEALLRRLPPPMGLGPKATDSDILRFVFGLNIPLDEHGLVPFHRTAYELVVRCTEAEIPEGELKRRLDRMIRRFLNRHAPKCGKTELNNIQVAITVMRLQRKWRAIVARRKAEREAARPVVPPLPLHLLPPPR